MNTFQILIIFKKLIEKSDQETLNYEMRRINGIKEILKGIK